MKHHPPAIRAPFYRPGSHLALHRYLDDEFIPTFLDDLANGGLQNPTAYAWLEQQRVGTYRDYPTLSLPLHRTFHLVSCEVSCAVPGDPAFDPQTIRSAGLVIRRTPRGGHTEPWMIERDSDRGWNDQVDPGDPDRHRRVRQVLGSRGAVTDPPYSGERTYPLHVTTARDAHGRRHTILYGFLPVGSGTCAKPRTDRPRIAPADLAEAKSAMAQELAWPFGLERNAPVSTNEVVYRGVPTRAMVLLLRTLVHRHRLGIDNSPANQTLIALIRAIPFDRPVSGLSYAQAADSTNDDVAPLAQRTYVMSLFDYLQSHTQADAEAADGRVYSEIFLRYLDLPLSDSGVPAPTPLPATNGSALNLHLHVDDTSTAALRSALVERVAGRAMQMADDIPLPRYGQDSDDIYVAQAFVRYAHDDNETCEHTVVGELTTVPFRVASPFTPEAIRPVLIQMPKFSDLKRGLMNAHFLTPDDLAQKILSLRIGKPLEVSKGSGPGFNLCWMFSFSIPAITICAMILLMIIISILNIIFFWIPYIFITLPFFCKRR